MENYKIELFLPVVADNLDNLWVENLAQHPVVSKVWLWSVSEPSVALPDNVEVLPVESLSGSAPFKEMARLVEGDFVLCSTSASVKFDAGVLDVFAGALPADAVMGYADYRKCAAGEYTDAPVIDYLAGSLRNDFDFGPLLLFRTSALKRYHAESLEEYRYAGMYQLRLAMSRYGSIYHHQEYLSAVYEYDTRKSGEKQFDYVNPAQRDVQAEMEKACTWHLKAIDGCLPACKYRDIDLSIGDFPVEASVVIPVLNRRSTIADAIGSVLKQRTSFPFNLIVVDNHSTDGTSEIIGSFADDRVVHIIPERADLGIGGCWNEAVNSPQCGRFAVQLDSDDIYSDENTLQRIVDEFYRQQCAMIVGTYRICDFELNTLPPGIIDHREWTEGNGRNNALRINGLGAPRAFFTPVIREVGFPNVSYGEDYAVGLRISRDYRIGRIYDVLYLCRRWGGNSDAALSHEKVNAHNLYKDSLRTAELEARIELMKSMVMPSHTDVEEFVGRQLALWPDAAAKHEALDAVEVRPLSNGLSLQHNPARAISTGAKVDAASIAARKCFLCASNRPSEQISQSVLGTLEVLVNPYPILPSHLTLPLKEHSPQMFAGMYTDMLHIAREWSGLALFYNGAKCGASAPDHAHLQAGDVGGVPLFGDYWREEVDYGKEPVLVDVDGCLYNVTSYVVPLFMIVSRTVSCSVDLCRRLVAALPVVEGEYEPRMNVFVHYVQGEGYVTMVLPRSQHRPSCYYAEDETCRLVSPGALDMAGLIIVPRRSDFEVLTADDAVAILREVALSADYLPEVIENIINADDEEC